MKYWSTHKTVATIDFYIYIYKVNVVNITYLYKKFNFALNKLQKKKKRERKLIKEKKREV